MAKWTRTVDLGTATSSASKWEAPQPSPSQPHQRELIPPQSDSDQLPLYSRDQPDALHSIAELANTICNGDNVHLPLLAYPPSYRNGTCGDAEQIRRLQQVVDTYFDALKSGSVEFVAAFSGAGLITAETTNEQGRTPLLAAIEAGHTHMVRYLLDVGAAIDTYGVTATTLLGLMRHGMKNELHTYRTPLQYAAQTGNLPIVKLLMDRGADDALIAPDGELALRLAASNGHREVVHYLPSRRGGGFRRWKTKHSKAMRRCKKATHGIYIFGKFFVWDLPKFFVWTIPKHAVVLPLVEGMKWLYEHRKEIPKLLADAAKDVAIGMKKFPAQAWKALKELPGALWETIKKCASFIWRSVKRLPHGMKIALVWLWTGLKRSGLVVGLIIGRFFSFIHTACAAVLSCFQHITLRDVMNAFLTCIHAVIIDAPKKIWVWMSTFGKASYKVLKAIFGFLGECVWFLIHLMLGAVTYVPEKIWEMLVACGGSMRSGGKELLVWIDPKRV